MKINKTSIPYLIHCLSPMHVGSGDSNYGIIDNLVQRDSLTNYPVIHSSSLKGALREYFSYRFESNGMNGNDKVQEIFGADHSKRDEEEGKIKERDFKAGLFEFDLGFLLSLPVRSSKMLFANVTTPTIIQQFKNRIKLYEYAGQNSSNKLLEELNQLEEDFGTVSDVVGTNTGMEGAILEEFDVKVTSAKSVSAFARSVFGDNMVVMPDDKFKDIVEALPVIARNKLNNGQSINLFYEEVVPRETRFYTIITTAHWRDRHEKSKSVEEWFHSIMQQDELIQLGANGSVGYGKTVFTNLYNSLDHAKIDR